MPGVVRRVVTRYYRGVPLAEALKNFHTHIVNGHEVVLMCSRCESPRIRNNQLGGDLFQNSAPNAEFTCLDCGENHNNDSSLQIINRTEFEAYVIEEHQDSYE